MQSKSISVNSLIGRDREDPEVPKVDINIRKKSPSKDILKDTPQLNEIGLLKGLEEFKDMKDFPFSESAFLEAVKLKMEQEKTRQEQIKLDIAKKNHDIITAAISANIPGNLIPSMCITSSTEESTSSHHSRSNSVDYNAPPLNYKFGGNAVTSSTAPTQSNSRSSSLAKVPQVNLKSPSSTYRPVRTPLSHQRHYSMPVVQNPSIDLGKIDTQTQQYQQFQNKQKNQVTPPYVGQYPPQLYQYPQMYQYPPQLAVQTPQSSKSPNKSHSRSRSSSTVKSSGKSSTLQSSSSRSNNPPSQESMTSFQHVIQFQHWKPEDPASSYDQPGVSGILPERSHKRHKSNFDNMSVDLGNNPIQEEGDVSMEEEKKS
ncbi:hypothetical protein CLIB1444_06S00210 [[Candida] jaroonii]|uniref:Uncharacterized protein n=1 Tax=[Candida] jaroonii TaxID=467808 RepID=A0ACA9Y950_9ASCO|nr:hypothetical protein CLIB1444_06S00210 [[Candida] jaroonii]